MIKPSPESYFENKLNENDVFFSNDTGKLGKNKSQVLLSGIEPKNFRLLVRGRSTTELQETRGRARGGL